MASFMVMGRNMDGLPEMFLSQFYGAMHSLRMRDEEGVVNFVENYSPSFENQGIVATGFSGLEFPPDQGIFSKIQDATGLPVFQVPSICNTVGVARVPAPYLEIFTIPRDVKGIIKKLREVRIFWDLEFHYIGSNVSRKKDNFCVKVNLTEIDAGKSANIILHLRELRLNRDQIQINLIQEFFSAKRMRQ